MFMQIAIGAIGVAIVLFVGYIIVAQVRTALPSSTTVGYVNQCEGLIGQDLTSGTTCYGNVSGSYGNTYYGSSCGTGLNLTGYNTTHVVSCANTGYASGTNSAMTTVFAGFGLVAVGIIVLAAFGLIQVFQ